MLSGGEGGNVALTEHPFHGAPARRLEPSAPDASRDAASLAERADRSATGRAEAGRVGVKRVVSFGGRGVEAVGGVAVERVLEEVGPDPLDRSRSPDTGDIARPTASDNRPSYTLLCSLPLPSVA